MRHKKKKAAQQESVVDNTIEINEDTQQEIAPQDESVENKPQCEKSPEDLIKTLEQEKNELADRLLRTMAEFDNYRKRMAREKEGLVKYGIERLSLEILPVVDNFERALEQSQQTGDADPVIEGLEMTLKQLLTALEKFDIKSFNSVGEKFSPEIHEAMAQQEHPDHEDNTVIEQFQKGYMLGERLLRPARVMVSSAPATEKPESTD